MHPRNSINSKLGKHRDTQSHHNEMLKDKEKILKAGKEKSLITYQGTPISLTADFPTRNNGGKKATGKYS